MNDNEECSSEGLDFVSLMVRRQPFVLEEYAERMDEIRLAELHHLWVRMSQRGRRSLCRLWSSTGNRQASIRVGIGRVRRWGRRSFWSAAARPAGGSLGTAANARDFTTSDERWRATLPSLPEVCYIGS
jgi:hypothetical protein